MDGDNCGGTWVKEHRVQAVKRVHFGSLEDIGIWNAGYISQISTWRPLIKYASLTANNNSKAPFDTSLYAWWWWRCVTGAGARAHPIQLQTAGRPAAISPITRKHLHQIDIKSYLNCWPLLTVNMSQSIRISPSHLSSEYLHIVIVWHLAPAAEHVSRVMFGPFVVCIQRDSERPGSKASNEGSRRFYDHGECTYYCFHI